MTDPATDPAQEAALDRIGAVIEYVETALARTSPRPAGHLVRETVLAIFLAETEACRSASRPFDPAAQAAWLVPLLEPGRQARGRVFRAARSV